jgi:hypothetical protein
MASSAVMLAESLTRYFDMTLVTLVIETSSTTWANAKRLSSSVSSNGESSK